MAETTIILKPTSAKAVFPASSNSTWWLEPTPLVILFSIFLAISIPLFLHFVIFRSNSNNTLPTFVLVGPSGAGKTALQTLIERTPSGPSKTTTSQTPLTIEASVPVSFSIASNRYRSVNDPSHSTHKKLLLTDTPGHGKLRHHGLSLIRSAATTKTSSSHIRGIVFVVDASGLAAETPELRDAAEYLHDVLLALQTGRGAASGKEFPVLVVVNKGDLFTALPYEMAEKALEAEIGRIRSSRARNILAAGSKEGELDAGEERWLGQGGEGPFEFSQMDDAGVNVNVVGTKVEGNDGTDVEAVWTWIGEQL